MKIFMENNITTYYASAPYACTITELLVQAEDYVEANQAILTVKTDAGVADSITIPANSVVLDVYVAAGQYVKESQPLMRLTNIIG